VKAEAGALYMPPYFQALEAQVYGTELPSAALPASSAVLPGTPDDREKLIFNASARERYTAAQAAAVTKPPILVWGNVFGQSASWLLFEVRGVWGQIIVWVV
jgi:hypothetical protein